MVIIITSYLLIFLAAFCNSIMDKVDHHFSTSIFSNIKSKKLRLWFNEDKGWLNKYVDRDYSKGRIKWEIFGVKFNKPVQISDAWHFFKMWMIIFICLIPAINFIYPPIIIVFVSNIKLNLIINVLIHLGICGNIWNLTFFRLFYNNLLKKNSILAKIIF
jgi:hypothetical protein